MTGMSRRQFGVVTLAPLGALGLAACSPTMSDPASTSAQQGDGLTVVVVGAGVAGLAAAHELTRAGAQITVLEARDYIGGRTVTVQRDGVAIDLGASWIHGVDGNPVTELVESAGIQTIATDLAASIVYDPADPTGLVDEVVLARAAARLNGAVTAGYDTDIEQSMRAVVEQAAAGAPDDQARLVRHLATTAIENEYAGSIDELSAWWFDEAGEFRGGDAMIAGGYGQVPALLAEGLDVRLGADVTSVRWSADTVTVQTATESFEADAVVVTVPLGVLQAATITFDPPLPAAQQTAIARLGMGVLNKVILRFDAVFWDDTVDWIGIVTPVGLDPWVDWVTLGRPNIAPVLMGFAAGDWGRQVDQLTDAQVLASALATLRSAYPDAPEPIEAIVTRWGADPHSRGSYSFAAVGSDPSMRNDLAAPAGERLHLAGEATSREHPSTVHGALLSGRRAAENVLSSLSG
jgi:polyamine oxidase